MKSLTIICVYLLLVIISFPFAAGEEATTNRPHVDASDICISMNALGNKINASGNGDGSEEQTVLEEPASLEKEKIMETFKSSSLFFNENAGQFSEEVLFLARTPAATIALHRDGIMSILRKTSDSLVQADKPNLPHSIDRAEHRAPTQVLSVKTEFIGASKNGSVRGEEVLSHHCNYFIGNDPDQWHTDVPNYKSVRHEGIYPGIDLMLYFNDNGSLKYDLILSPGADPSVIKIRYDGVENMEVTPVGSLEMGTKFGPIYENTPHLYQEIDGIKHRVDGGYVKKGPSAFGFIINESYDSSYPLVIDPVLDYSTYLGGGGYDFGAGIAIDDYGNAYVTGHTESSNFPIKNAFDGTYNGNSDVFIKMILPGTLRSVSMVMWCMLWGQPIPRIFPSARSIMTIHTTGSLMFS